LEVKNTTGLQLKVPLNFSQPTKQLDLVV